MATRFGLASAEEATRFAPENRLTGYSAQPDRQRLDDDNEPTRAIQEKPRRSSVLDELTNEIGADAAARLIDIFGGTRLYVPQSPDEDDLLTASLGHEAALKLARVYGGDRTEVPNPTPRRARIIELRETGCSVDAIARKLGCTRRRVFQVLAEARATKRIA
jgi:Homeodomain-like domain